MNRMTCGHSLAADSANVAIFAQATCLPSPHPSLVAASLHYIDKLGAMGKSRASKLKRLNDFRRSMPHVTTNALSKVLRGIIDQGMPSLTNRNDMREATMAQMDEETPHGPLLIPVEFRKIDDTAETILAVNPFAYLYHAYRGRWGGGRVIGAWVGGAAWGGGEGG